MHPTCPASCLPSPCIPPALVLLRAASMGPAYPTDKALQDVSPGTAQMIHERAGDAGGIHGSTGMSPCRSAGYGPHATTAYDRQDSDFGEFSDDRRR